MATFEQGELGTPISPEVIPASVRDCLLRSVARGDQNDAASPEDHELDRKIRCAWYETAGDLVKPYNTEKASFRGYDS